MAKYAKDTKVPVSRSKTQIEKVLVDWGIDEFFFGTSPKGDGIGFKHKDRTYKMSVPVPQDCSEGIRRQMWRILFMSLKMKLEEIDAGVRSFEDQFLAMMCLPDGSTVGEFMKLPANVKLLQKAQMPNLLTGGD